MIPFLFDYLPEDAPELLKFAGLTAKTEKPSRARVLARALAATAVGGGLGYAGGKLLAKKLGPKIPPAAVGGLAALLSGAVVGAQGVHNKKLTEVLNAHEGRKDRPSRRSP